MAKAAVDLRSLARSHTEMGLRVLCGIAQNGENESARVRAVELIWERGWGKAAQTHTGADGEGPISVVIRHIIRGEPQPQPQPQLVRERRTIEHVPNGAGGV